MSIRLLLSTGPKCKHQLSDDLESFIWLFLDITTSLFHWKLDGSRHERHIVDLLLGEADFVGGEWTGGTKKLLAVGMFPARSYSSLSFDECPTLTTLWKAMFSPLQVFYYGNRMEDLPPGLKDHSDLLKAFEGWPQTEPLLEPPR